MWTVYSEPAIARFIPLGARSHQSLNSSKTVNCAPQQLSNQLVHLDHLWRSLAQLLQSSDWPIPVFKPAKELQDGVGLVCYPPHPPRTLRTLIIILYLCLQVTSEKAELLAALTKYEKAINLKELGDDCDCDCDCEPFSKHVRNMSLDHLPSGMATLPRNVLKVIEGHFCPEYAGISLA